MFCLVNFARHDLEIPLRLDSHYERRVDNQVAEGCRVFVARGSCGAGEVVVVRGAEEEDALAVGLSGYKSSI
jgi:hypothetical protein